MYQSFSSKNILSASVAGVILAMTLSSALTSQSHAFTLDQKRGVFTLAPVLKKVRSSVVRIQLGTRKWAKGSAGPGGIGSGFIVDAKRGIILTNHHVVKGARRIYALTSNRKSFRARVLGTSKSVDLAVLQINAADLSQITLGSSETVEIGDMNIVVGFPFGLAMSTSIGIVSAGGGKVSGRYNEDRDSIQTDAAINPGNSGGPFLNSKGEVIGVNTSILGDNGGTSLGIGFGIPINVALKTMNRILRNRKMASIDVPTTRTSHIAIASSKTAVQPVALLQKELKFGFTLQSLASHLGVLVKRVDVGSLANMAGLKSGDTILKIDNADISSSTQLVQQLDTKKDSKVRVIFKRGEDHYETFLHIMAG